MTTAAIEYIWQAILESERSDDLAFIDAMARKMLSARSDALSREPVTTAAIESLRAQHDTLPAVTLPLLSRP